MNTPVKQSMKLVTTAVAAIVMSGCVIHVNASSSANVRSQQSLSLDAAQLTALDIETGAGSLIVKGDAQVDNIEVKAVIFTSKDDSGDYELTLEEDGDGAILIAKNDSNGFYIGNSPRIDLEVSLPAHMQLSIDDGSGSIAVSYMENGVTIEDGSGSLSLQHIMGKVDIDDGSGGMELNDIQGDIRITDGSGSLTINQVQGSVDIEDGSGGIDIMNVQGYVTIDDGSGSISVSDSEGLNVVESGSGGLNISNVKNVTTAK